MNLDFHALLKSHARRTPSKVVFSFYVADELQTVTYAQFDADIDACLEKGAYGCADLVFIVSSISYDSIVAYLSCFFMHAVPAFLPPLTLRQDKHIHETEMQALLQRFTPNAIIDAQGTHRIHDRENPVCRAHNGFLQFSSGTTSLKKGVLITEEKLISQLESLGAALTICADDKIASWLPLYHDMGLITSLFLPLYYGCSVAYLDPVEWSFRPDSLFKVIEREQATLCWQPDFAFRHLANFYKKSADAQPRDLSSLRRIINCSEPCRVSTFLDFLDTFGSFSLREDSLQTCYAMAETVFAISQSQFKKVPDAADTDFLPSGLPIDGCEIRIVNVSDEGYGEIHVKSEFLFGGYFNQETKTISPEGWYNTGDLGLLRNGQLYVAGRTDDTLIVNGKKIIAHQIEDYVGSQPGFKPGRVFCTLNRDGTALALYFEGEELSAGVRGALRKWAATASGVSLDSLTALPEGTLIKSSSGKIARRKTLDKLHAGV